MGIAGEARPLRRDDSIPLWSQLEAELRRRIKDGNFSERFPTDLEITRLYGVSRHTARHAVDRLASEHLVTRERGRGTVVNRLKFEQSLETLYSIFQLVEAEGAEQKSTVLALEVVVDAQVAARLGLPPDAELTFLDRVRFADGEPLARDRVWMDAATTSDLLECDFSHTALYHELERTGGPRPTNGTERITPVIPSASERRLLGLDKRSAAFRLERSGLYKGKPVEWRVTVVRGDRLAFLADWSAGRSSAFRLSARENR